jgi:tRNA-2-methylthio-N6-dimethylallyladenosine synthase
VCGTGNLGQVPDLVEEILEKRTPRLAVDRLDEEYGLDGVTHREDRFRASVTIMKGCDHRCTYCIVPTTRGVERSRASESLLTEMRDLASRGFLDVMLLGQNVNSYGKGLTECIDFAGLLEKIQSDVPKIPRLRFMTSHPKDAHTRLFSAMRELPMVCEHLHLPVQSGSNAVLRRMKLEHTIEWYLDQVGEYSRFVPKGSLTTDFIVGFPGESERDFLQTLELVQKEIFDSAYIFTYSPRPGTPAMKLADDVPNEEKERRLQTLLIAQRAVSLKKNQTLIGSTEEVLFESFTRRDENRYVGRTRSFKRVVVSSPVDLCGRLAHVLVNAVADETLLGELVDQE